MVTTGIYSDTLGVALVLLWFRFGLLCSIFALFCSVTLGKVVNGHACMYAPAACMLDSDAFVQKLDGQGEA